MADRTTRYVTASVLAAAALAVAFPITAGVPTLNAGAVVLYVLAVAVADRTEIVFRLERATASFTLIEAAIAAGLLLLPVGYLVPATAAGVVLSQFSQRLPLEKGAFNVAMPTVGTAAAGVVVLAWPALERIGAALGPTVGAAPLLAALVGMACYVAINALMLGGVLRRHAGPDASAAAREQLPLTAAMMIGSTAVGVLIAALWTTPQPWLVVFVLAPAAAVYLAGRGALRSAQLLAEMRSEHDRLERVVDGASDGILLLDQDGRIQVWNPAMAQLTGIPGDEAVGRPVAEVLRDDVRQAEHPVRGRWLVDHAHDGAARRTANARFVTPDGTAHEVRESHALVFDDRGRCTGDVVVAHDVSRQRELDRLRSDFVARISHELRTPLTPIRGFASVLLRHTDDLAEAEQGEIAARILERADHLHELVEDLLLVTRLDRDELDDLVDRRPIAIEEVVATCVAAAREEHPDRPITLDVSPEIGRALADPDQVRRITGSLLANAGRYSPDGTPIEVDVDTENDDIRVRVRDHGPGVPKHQREAIFEQFHRLEDPLTMRTSGVGLGLYIARRLATAMHGSLELLPTARGQGATFELRLPAADPPHSETTELNE